MVDSTASAAKSSKRVTDSKHSEHAGARSIRGRIPLDGHGDYRLVSEPGHHPGGHADEPAKQKAQEWATVENQKDVVGAMKSDDAEDLTKALVGIHMEEEKSSNGGGGRQR